MKIIYLHQYFNTPSMSGGSRSYQMAKRLVSKGHEVHVVTSLKSRDKSESYSEVIDGINVHWIPVEYSNTMNYTRRIFSFILFAIKSTSKSIRLGGDLIFATSTPLTIIIPAYVSSRLSRIPYVFEVRDLWPELPIAMGVLNNPLVIWIAKKMEKFSYKNAAKVVALSPGMAEGVMPYNSDVTTIPNSSDLKEFSYSNLKEKKFRSDFPEIGESRFGLYAGTFGAINGVSYLVDVACELKRIGSDFKIVTIGQGFEWEETQKYARESGVLNDNFFIYPAISKNELVDAFSAATIGFSLFIELKEMEANSANKFFDTLAAGIPAVINYGGWQKEILETHNAGFYMGRNARDSAIQIDKLISDSSSYKEVSKNALNLAKSEFCRDKLALKLESVLSNVLTCEDK